MLFFIIGGPSLADLRENVQPMAENKRSRRTMAILAAAAVAGLMAGTAAVYVRESGFSNAWGLGNVATADPDCADALLTAKRMAPLATGEVAAFRVADKGEAFNDLTFTGPDGKPSSLAALNGKVVLLNLWATWCVPCRAEMPALDRLQAAMGGDQFTVAAVNVDVKNPERAKSFLSDIGVKTLAFYADPTLGIFNALKERGLAFGLPTTLLVDGKGCKLGIVEGPAEWDSEDAKALIRAAIAPATATS
jgi:thiol-disulfide isomerase/thioredoxin